METLDVSVRVHRHGDHLPGKYRMCYARGEIEIVTS